MKRRIRKIGVLLLFLSGGAIVNVAVAWGCGAFADLRAAPEQFNVTHDPKTWSWIADTRRDGLGASQSIRRELSPRKYGVSGSNYTLEFDDSANPLIVLEPGETIEEEGRMRHLALASQGNPYPQRFMTLEPWRSSYGWPLRSLCCWLDNQLGYPSSMAAARRGPVSVVAGIDLSERNVGPDSHVLPLQPLWGGFAINTMFYALVVWLLVAGSFALRRRRRMKRGLCPACAYPIGSSAVCTECGAALPQRA